MEPERAGRERGFPAVPGRTDPEARKWARKGIHILEGVPCAWGRALGRVGVLGSMGESIGNRGKSKLQEFTV